MFVFEGAWMFVSKQESRIWDDRYRSAIEEEGRVLRQSISDNVMQVPERIASMLDIGCGMGDMVMAWAERGVDATGLDISAEAIHTRRLLQKPRRGLAASWQGIGLRWILTPMVGVVNLISYSVRWDRICGNLPYCGK